MNSGLSCRALRALAGVLVIAVGAAVVNPAVADTGSRTSQTKTLDCTSAYASPSTFSAHSRKTFTRVRIKGVKHARGIKTLCVKQDEAITPGKSVDAYNLGKSSVRLRRYRDGNGDGRVYHIGFKAWGDNGQQCTGVVSTQVPLRYNRESVDGGAIHDATAHQIDCSVFQSTHRPPVIHSTAPAQATVGSLYQYPVEANDPDGDTLSYQLQQAPTGMQIDTSTGLIHWQPTSTQIGTHNVVLQVSDGVTAPVSQAFMVDVTLAGQCAAEDATVTFAGFGEIDRWHLLGAATTTQSHSSPRLRLTPRSAGQRGAAYYQSAISLSTDKTVSAYFKFQMHQPTAVREHDGAGADGLTFVIAAERDQLGPNGGHLAYQGIDRSLAIEFDTWQNVWDSNGNHIGININGDLHSVTTHRPHRRINSGRSRHVWLQYKPTSERLSVWYSSSSRKPHRPILQKQVDLRDLLQSDQAYLGFTSATGDAAQIHDILVAQFKAVFVKDDCVEETLAFTSAPATSTVAGQEYAYRAEAVSTLNEAVVTYSLTDAPPSATIDVQTGQILWTPDLNAANTTVSFTVVAESDQGGRAEQTFTVSVEPPPNQAPTADDLDLATDEDTAISFTLQAADPNGDNLGYSVLTTPAHGTLNGTAPNLTYQPSADFVGSDQFTYQANDGQLSSNTATVTLTMVPVNDAPLAESQSLNGVEDTPLPLTLSGTDPEGDDLSYVLLTQPSHGTLSGTAPTVVYTPNANYHGVDSFTFGTNDGAADSEPATVTITLAAQNDAPVAATQSTSTDEDSAVSIILSGIDPEGDVLSYAVSAQPEHGTLSGTVPNLDYTPNENYHGQDSFTFVVNDGTVNSEAATITISVAPINDAPVAAAQALNIDEDTELSLTLSGSDVDGDSLAYRIESQPANGQLTGAGQAWTYTPNENYHGQDSFTFVVNDGQVDSEVATVSITVTPINDAPVATPASYTLDENSSVDFILEGSDIDGDSLEYQIVTQPSHGVISGQLPNVTYTPNADYSGSDNLRFTVSDDHVESLEVSIDFVINAVNHPPVIVSDPVITAFTDRLYEYTLIAEDDDGDSLSYALDSSLAGMQISDTGVITWTPSADQIGSYAVTINVLDSAGGEVTQTYTLEVLSSEPKPAHQGTEFWLTFMPNFNATSDVLSVTLSSEVGATGSIEIIASGKIIPFSVAENDATQITFDQEDYADITANRPGNGYEATSVSGIRISSDTPITVYGLNQIQYSTDGFLALPKPSLGKRYIGLSYDVQVNPATSQLAILAVEDNTRIEVKTAFDWSGDDASYERDFDKVVKRGETVVKQLDSGQVYFVEEHIAASEIASDKPVAVFSGNRCTTVNYNPFFSCDHLIEQQIPAGALGHTYFSVPYAHRKNGDRFMFATTEDQTEIFVNDTLVAQLDAGRVFETVIDEAARIFSTKPIVAAQIAHSDGVDKHIRVFNDYALDPFMVNLTAEQHFLKSYVFATPNSAIDDNFANLVVKADNLSSLLHNGVSVDTAIFTPIPGTDYAGGTLSLSHGKHVIESDQPFGLYIYGYADWDSYGYAGGFAFSDGDAISRIEQIGSTPNSAAVGTQFCSRFKASDGAGQIIANAPLQVLVDGANKISTMAYTDITGIAEFCYSAIFEGGDSIVVSSHNAQSETVSVNWSNNGSSTPLSLVIDQHPDSNIRFRETYSSQVSAQSPASGSALIYSLLESPNGMQINAATGEITWDNPSNETSAEFLISVTDDDGREVQQKYRLTNGHSNHPPNITSDPVVTVPAGTKYLYELIVEDDDSHLVSANKDLPRIHFKDRPSEQMTGVFSDPANDGYQITWTVDPALEGTSHQVTIVAADRRGGYDEQTYTLEVVENLPIVITSDPILTARVGRRYSYYPTYTDPENQYQGSFSFSLKEGPEGFGVGNNYLYWTPNVDQVGDHLVSYAITDNVGNETIQTFTLTVVDEPNVLPEITSDPARVIGVGFEFTYQITAIDTDGDPLRFGLSGSLPAGAMFNTSSGLLKWTPTNDQLGDHDITLTVNDTYETVNHTFTLSVTEDNVAPVAEITTPESLATITVPTAIQGLVDDENLLEWRLELSRIGSHHIQVLASGEQSFTTQEIAIVDPTQLKNGLYDIVLIATDVSRNETVEGVTLRVDGNLKVGNFSFTVEDIAIELDGIPIQVSRTYDTRQRNELGAFGYGWTIDYQNVEIQESRVPGRGWQMSQYASGPLGVLTDYCVEPVSDIDITVRLPNGKLESFAVSAEPHCNTGVPINDVKLIFTAKNGVTSTLESINDDLYRLFNGNLTDFDDASIANPDTYRLTTQSGYVYQLDQNFGIRAVSTPFGTTLTYDDSGITHSNGTSVEFSRNASGQITRIKDPRNTYYYYNYNSDKDLISVSYPVSGVTTYTYNDSHHILDIIDPLNRSVLKNIYDNAGRLIAQEDADGNRTAFNHDIEGRQSVVTDRLGRSTAYYYDDRGNVLSEVDALGNVTSYTYDAQDNQLTKTNALGYTETATYDDRYNQLTQTDALGYTTRFTYNARGQELTITDALGHQYNNTYDSYGNLLSIEDPAGNLSGQNINPRGLVSLRRDAEGNETAYTYDGSGNVLTETDAEGVVTTYTYDANGNQRSSTITRTVEGQPRTERTDYYYNSENRLTQTINALGRSEGMTYDKVGNVIATRDVLGRTTEMTYDPYGRLLTTEYPDGTTETKTYDPEGNLSSETNRLGQATSYEYDALDRLIKTTYTDGSSTETVYDAIGRVIEEIDERGNSTTHSYDAANRRIKTTDALGNETTFAYDANGNLIEQTDANGHTTTYSYNSLDQRIQTEFDDGSTIETVFDKVGRQIETIDQNGRSMQYAYDGLGRLTTVTDSLGQVTSYSYDEAGNKLTQTDAEGRTTSWTYDALGREKTRTLPLGQRESFSYDAVGNRTGHTDFNGNSHSFSYDEDNDWLTGENYADGTTTTFSYDALGNRISASDTRGSYSYSYDSRQRLTQEIKPDGTRLDYTYDEAGNKLSLSSMVNGTVTTTDYIYDELNRLSSVTDTDANVTTYNYDAVGNRASVDHSNGTKTTYSYDSLNRLTEIQHLDSLSNVMQSFSYLLDATGRRTQITEANGRTTDYSYDELYRLTDEVITDGINGNYSANYQYDKVGNRIYSTIEGVQTAYTYDDNDRLTQQGGTTYVYDDNGNTLSESIDADQTTYQWDSQNRLIQSSATTSFGTTTSAFAYDIDDNRINKTVDDNGNLSDVGYIVDNNQDYAQVLHEVDTATQDIEVTYAFGDDLISQTRSGVQQLYHYDGLGSTRLLTDASGNTTDTYYYEAFGDLLSHTGFSENSYLYTGEQYDSELDQYYLRARYYDQTTGRFSSMDSWMGINSDPQTLHKYLYANVDPVNTIDPTGQFGMSGVMSGLSIASTIASTAQTAYSVFQVATGERELSARELATEILLSRVGGASAQKMLGLMGKKSKEFVQKNFDSIGCFFNSFPEGTLVHTENGLISIEDIEIGDKVLAFNEETQQNEYQEVTHLIQNERNYNFVSLHLDTGEVVEATPEHPFYANGKWKQANELEASDNLYILNSSIRLSEVERGLRYDQVFNITVNNIHTFFVGTEGILVHNMNKNTGCKLRGRKAKGFKWDDILRKHSPDGRTNRQRARANHTEFTGLTDSQIKARVKGAWKNRELKRSQFDPETGKTRLLYEGIDTKTGSRVGFWFNSATQIVETAFPK